MGRALRPALIAAALGATVLSGCSSLPDWAVPGVLREDASPAPKPKPAATERGSLYPELVDVPAPPTRAATPEEREALRRELEAALKAAEEDRASGGEVPTAPGS